jgi:hypothetical protein
VELDEAKGQEVRTGPAQRAESDSELSPHAIEIDVRPRGQGARDDRFAKALNEKAAGRQLAMHAKTLGRK